MALDLKLLASKLARYRAQFQSSVAEVAQATGITRESLEAFEAAKREPTGDEILILADFYKCDFKFFISNDLLAPFEQTENLFRRLGERLSKQDRWAIQEFLYLCECEEQLMSSLGGEARQPFEFAPQGSFFKGQGRDAAAALRKHLGYGAEHVPLDLYRDLRRLRLHVFRRRLENSDISGLFVKHPVAGKCVLVNFSEDLYRQRFSAAHELGHSVLDGGEDFVVDADEPIIRGKWDQAKLVEIRANVFASSYLVPPDLLRQIPEPAKWTSAKALEWASKLGVNTTTLALALSASDLIDKGAESVIRAVKVPKSEKQDPELPDSLSAGERSRKMELLERGLSDFYVGLCFDAYEANQVSAARIAEMLLVSETELRGLARIYGRALAHGD